jgi:hypothetical protein
MLSKNDLEEISSNDLPELIRRLILSSIKNINSLDLKLQKNKLFSRILI